VHSGRASALAPTCFGLILVLKAMRSAVDAWFGPSFGWSLRASGAGRFGRVRNGLAEASKLSRKPIRAEDIAGWGV
jgi:hypothetical protein